MSVNYHHLYYFFVVAAEGSIKAASKKLNVSQPTISHQIKLLEQYFDVPLFERTAKTLILNSHGKALYKEAERLFHLGSQIENIFKDPEQETRKILHVGAVPSLPNSFIHRYCLRMWSDPQVSLKVTHASLTELLARLEDRQIDLILSDSQAPGLNSKIQSISLKSERLVAVGGSRFSNLRRGFPRSLHRQPYLSFTKDGQIQKEIDYYFDLHQIIPEQIGFVDDVTLVRVVAEKSLCFAILPKEAVEESVERGELLILGELANVRANFWLLTTNPGGENPLVRQTIAHYRVIADD